jgi:hypothetical protein
MKNASLKNEPANPIPDSFSRALYLFGSEPARYYLYGRLKTM